MCIFQKADFGSKMVCNDDAPDAFYYHGEIKASGTNHPIELRRPFAQINIGTDDYDTAVKAGMTVTSRPSPSPTSPTRSTSPQAPLPAMPRT